jgi:hypothetical protein
VCGIVGESADLKAIADRNTDLIVPYREEPLTAEFAVCATIAFIAVRE